VTDAAVVRYHDGTKHHFHRFAPSLGYLDWASQPHPFRSFEGAPVISLPRNEGQTARPVTYDHLFQPDPVSHRIVGHGRRDAEGPPAVSQATIGDVLRHALGLSAWKQFRESRWALRVNPSSGNLHPTEAYVVAGAVSGLADTGGVYHYAPDRHALELRCAFAAAAWQAACGDPSRMLLVALTSIHWREAWKYGERAFRYCQHDLGHAIAALRLSAALVGWRMTLQPSWPQRVIAALIGIDRDEDYVDAEREEPACLLLATAGSENAGRDVASVAGALVDAARGGTWHGRASQLSEDHVEWTFIDEVARATEDPGRDLPAPPAGHTGSLSLGARGLAPRSGRSRPVPALDARALVLQRRSALAFDGRSAIDLAGFVRMLARVMPGAHAPWDVLWWDARIHLALFVQRVDGIEPGLYFLPREEGVVDRLKDAVGGEFLWESALDGELPLVRLARGDCRRLAARLSCDQDIAADGFFSLGMLADFDASLQTFGPSFYRHLFWESGIVGQVLYLEAEAAGARATGIGCFYDDPVHEVLGLTGHAFQSLYHFTVGMPVEDTRLTTEPGYAWDTP
jgi:SagB-type dehydrogenase family enzyme